MSKNNTQTCWVLKCDIKKFFANIDHGILIGILKKHISDQRTLGLLKEIISSFSSGTPGIGLPLGNLTSQLLVNVYMHEFDQFVKHRLKVKHYIRYADDFVIFSDDRLWLERQLPLIRQFLGRRLKLRLHEDKVFIKTLTSGVDFLGWVYFFDHRVLRTATKRRMERRLLASQTDETLDSSLGLLNHGNTRKLQSKIVRFPISSV